MTEHTKEPWHLSQDGQHVLSRTGEMSFAHVALAREADMIDFRDEDSDLHVVQFVDSLASVIGKAVAAEREECAKVCEMKAHRWPYPSHGNAAAKLCAQAIRARAIEREILGE